MELFSLLFHYHLAILSSSYNTIMNHMFCILMDPLNHLFVFLTSILQDQAQRWIQCLWH